MHRRSTVKYKVIVYCELSCQDVYIKYAMYTCGVIWTP